MEGHSVGVNGCRRRSKAVASEQNVREASECPRGRNGAGCLGSGPRRDWIMGRAGRTGARSGGHTRESLERGQGVKYTGSDRHARGGSQHDILKFGPKGAIARMAIFGRIRSGGRRCARPMRGRMRSRTQCGRSAKSVASAVSGEQKHSVEAAAPALQALLDWLGQGCPIRLYDSS